MTDSTTSQDPKNEPGKDSRVEDWFGQSVQRDAELADELTSGGDVDIEQAEAEFDATATGEDEQEKRHGDTIDPDQGRSAYGGDTSSAAESDPDSPGATIDDAEPAEPNEPG